MNNRKPTKREERAFRGLQVAEDDILDAYRCEDPYEDAKLPNKQPDFNDNDCLLYTSDAADE